MVDEVICKNFLEGLSSCVRYESMRTNTMNSDPDTGYRRATVTITSAKFSALLSIFYSSILRRFSFFIVTQMPGSRGQFGRHWALASARSPHLPRATTRTPSISPRSPTIKNSSFGSRNLHLTQTPTSIPNPSTPASAYAATSPHFYLHRVHHAPEPNHCTCATIALEAACTNSGAQSWNPLTNLPEC